MLTPEERLRQDWAETADPLLSTWLLTDGTLISCIDRRGSYNCHGFSVAPYYPGVSDGTREGDWQCAIRFMEQGNIRMACDLDSYYIQLLTRPTEKQLRRLMWIFGVDAKRTKADTFVMLGLATTDNCRAFGSWEEYVGHLNLTADLFRQ